MGGGSLERSDAALAFPAVWPLFTSLSPFLHGENSGTTNLRTVNIDNLDFVSDTWCLHGSLTTAKTTSRIKGVCVENLRDRVSQCPGHTVLES